MLKALEKYRARRYETANALALDLQRHLKDEPVSAGPPSAGYRIRKLVRRHRLAFGAAAAIFVLLAAGIAGSTWEAVRAKEAQRGAENAERQTRLGASQADADMAMELSHEGNGALALAHAVRALKLNADNQLASLLAYRLLSDGTISVPEHLMMHDAPVCAMAFSPDGARLATGCDDGAVVITDLDSGGQITPQAKFKSRPVRLAFSPDARSLAVGTSQDYGEDPSVAVWDYARSPTAAPTAISAHFVQGVVTLDWPLGDRIVVASGRTWGSGDNVTQVFGRVGETWKPVFGIGNYDPNDNPQLVSRIPGYRSSPSYSTWTVAGKGMLAIWNEGRLAYYKLEAFPAKVTPVWVGAKKGEDKLAHFSPATGVFYGMTASGVQCFDYLKQAFRSINLKDAHGSDAPENEAAISRVSENGERMMVQGRHGFQVVDCDSGEIIDRRPYVMGGGRELLDLSPNGLSWVLRKSDYEVLLCRSRANANVPVTVLALPASCLAGKLDPTDRWLALSSTDHAVRVWSLAQLRRRWPGLLPCHEPKEAVHLSRELTLDPQMRKFQAPASPPLTAKTSSDWELRGHFLYRVNSRSGTRSFVRLLPNIAAEQEDHCGILGHCFSPDGSRLVITYGTASSRPEWCLPSVAALFDTSTGKAVGGPLKHNDDVFSPSFSPNGRWFVTICDDGTVHRWDSASGAALGDPIRLTSMEKYDSQFQPQIRFVTTSPDGKWILAGDGRLIDAGSWRVVRTLSLALEHHVVDAFFEPGGAWMVTMSDTYEKAGGSESYVNFEQWDLRSGLRIGEPIPILENEFRQPSPHDWHRDSMHRPKGEGYAPYWLEPGRRLMLGKGLILECQPSWPAQTLVPFYDACQPLILGEARDQAINQLCSIRSLFAGEGFRGGGTSHTAGLEFASRLVGLGQYEKTFAQQRPPPAKQEKPSTADLNDPHKLLPLWEEAFATDPDKRYVAFLVAALQAWCGKDADHAATSLHMLEGASEANGPSSAGDAVQAYCLRPSFYPQLMKPAVTIARQNVNAGKEQPLSSWSQLPLGMAEYRFGNFPAADEALHAVDLAEDGSPLVKCAAQFYHAMSLFRQDKQAEARSLFNQAVAKMKPLPAGEKLLLANPLPNGQNQESADRNDADSITVWLAYKEAKALLQMEGSAAGAAWEKGSPCMNQ